jgi:exodeoxyribonuclease V beta subunit
MSRCFFDVLKIEKLPQRALIEASAGTGKTFTIEHLFKRLLLEEGLELEDILVVTFTKAAVLDLRTRIGALLENTILNTPKDKVKLQHTLELFSEAQIWTIHSFCLRMLQECTLETECALNSRESEGVSDVIRVVEDVLQMHHLLKVISPVQLNLLLRYYHYSVDELSLAVAQVLNSGKEVVIQLSFNEGKKSIEKLWLKRPILNLEELVPYIKGVCQRDGSLKEGFALDLEWLQKGDDFSVEKLILKRELLSFFNQGNLKKNTPEKIIQESKALLSYLELLYSYVHLLTDSSHLLFALVKEVEVYWKKYCKHWDLITPDAIIKIMHDSLSKKEFIDYLHTRFKAVLIDEFQDTDKLQWDIFKKLCIENSNTPFFYLVGDPKQAIYSFRSADVYTYVRAAKDIGESGRYFLGCCYRSDPDLVRALNALFSCKGLFPLPRENLELEYCDLSSSAEGKNKVFNDSKGSVHFVYFSENIGRAQRWPTDSFQEKQLFPYLANEIHSLIDSNTIEFKEIAVLVKDRYQGKNLQTFLLSKGIPCYFARMRNLTESSVVNALRELLLGIAYPQELDLIAIALGGQLLAWEFNSVALFSKGKRQKEILEKFNSLNSLWFSRGVGVMMDCCLQFVWKDSYSLEEQLIGSEFFYEDLLYLIYLCQELERKEGVSPEGVLRFLEKLSQGVHSEDYLQRPPVTEENSVTLMTMHLSKGLEFPIVFSIGTLLRTPSVGKVFSLDNKLKVASLEDRDLEEYCTDLDAEKLRQLYVALTRAKHRVYIPIIFELSQKDPKLATMSPIELALAIWGITSSTELKNKWNCCSSITYEEGGVVVCDFNPIEKTSTTIMPPPAFPYSFESMKMSSFSSLNEGYLKTNKIDSNDRKSSIHGLPAGREVGHLIHRLFEKTPFGKLSNPQKNSSFLDFHFNSTCLEVWKELFSFHLEKVFCHPLTETLKLNDIQPCSLIKELPFVYSYKQEIIKGVIDLLFEIKGKYYLLDWKTNYLGPSDHYYSREFLEKTMKEEGYHLQNNIYKEGLKRYLQLIDKRPFEECYGGSYFLFIRGMNGVDCEKGVYYSF